MRGLLYVVAVIASIGLVMTGIGALTEYREERAKAQQARLAAEKRASLLASRKDEWTSRKAEIIADIDRALKEGRPKDGQALFNAYREASGGELDRYEQPLKVALAVEGLNAIPQSHLIAREGALGELTRLDPENPRWRRELLAAQRAAEGQRRKDAEKEKRREREERARRRREGVSIGMTQERVLQSSWGKLERINRSTYASGTREQWVYGNGHYLYFENGVLTSIQTRN